MIVDKNEIRRSEDSDEIEDTLSVSSEDSTSQQGEIQPSFLGKDNGQIDFISGSDKKPRQIPTEMGDDQPLDAYYATFSGATIGSRLMQNPKALESTLESIQGNDDRIRITPTKRNPYQWIAHLLIIAKDNQQYVGTGWFCGNNTIITAGHCVYMRNHGGWPKSITVRPACDGQVVPYEFKSTSFRSVGGWTQNTSPDFDYGAILVAGSNYGSQHGYFGFANQGTSQLQDQLVNVVGYPADKRGNERSTLWAHARNLMSVSATRLEYDADTFGGQSGCPVYTTNNGQVIAVGIHTNGGALTNSGTRIRSDVYQNLLKWRNEGDNL